jgi:Ca-activated chloride channel family protein
MRLQRAAALGLSVLLAGVALSASAQTPPVVVTLESPSPFAPATGAIEIEAVVGSDEPIVRVDFLVDGVKWGEVTEPPYRMTVDVGTDNVEHFIQVIAFAASGETGLAEVSTPAFRSDHEVAVTLQQIYATVTCDGQRISTLKQGDFRLAEAGRSQEIVTFGSGDVPFTAIVLLDASKSMTGPKLANARRGVRAFLGGMRRLDEGKLMVFSDRLRSATPFSGLAELLTGGLDQIRADGGTAVYDHLYRSLRQLERRQGRRLVVVLSDGLDANSVLDTSVLLDTVRRSQALVYWLRLTDEETTRVRISGYHTAWRGVEENRLETERFEASVTESGGRIEEIRSPGQIEPAFREILAELREQYALGFYPGNRRHDGAWRPIEISVGREDCEVRSRGGFLDL